MGWAVRICKSKTQANRVHLRIGLGGDDNTHTDWTVWQSDMSEVIAVPKKFTDVQEIWIRGQAEPRGHNVHLCVQYNNQTTQKMTFDDTEEHETSQDDENDCDCA